MRDAETGEPLSATEKVLNVHSAARRVYYFHRGRHQLRSTIQPTRSAELLARRQVLETKMCGGSIPAGVKGTFRSSKGYASIREDYPALSSSIPCRKKSSWRYNRGTPLLDAQV
ncbi:hypothetical protein Moror_3207 [Moniliophthora roreri MCA 2997]|uniref:Uncharacterized protein n=1 Tax=Moniliophthora roreri (strain MCA 2997) TaxID=1381753 RepID=V2WNS4_MONRO|nr:hypothetical protein Moror_3207 [Moniliophthora roreri MCA 2997]